jgi:Phosphodiester glycosidase
MSPSPLPLHALRNAVLPRRHSRLERLRLTLADGARTTLHLASYDRDAYRPRVVALDRPQPLATWCRQQGIRHAVVGGFFLRPGFAPLGQLQVDGAVRPSVPFDEPWGGRRACVQIEDGELRIGRRTELDLEPAGDLLQAGPLLVRNGSSAIAGDDPEGFSAGAHQFDSDITLGRYPRAALACDRERLVSVACDGRTGRDAGMTLGELADALVDLGLTDAINLDGGGSSSLVHQGRLRNRPREEHGVDLLGGRPIVTAIVLEPR